jgi:plasmid stability protein
MKKTTLNLPDDLWRRLRLRAVYQSTSATKLVEQAIRLLLRTKPNDEPEPKAKGS